MAVPAGGNVLFLAALIWMSHLSYAATEDSAFQSVTNQSQEAYTKSLSALETNIFQYSSMTQILEHNTESLHKEENIRVRNQSRHPSNISEKATNGYYHDVTFTSVNVHDNIQKFTDSSLAVTSTEIPAEDSSRDGANIERESFTVAMNLVKSELNMLPSNIEEDLASTVLSSISSNLSQGLEITPGYNLKEKLPTIETTMTSHSEKTAATQVANHTISQTPSKADMSVENITEMTQNDQEINQSLYSSEVNPEYSSETSSVNDKSNGSLYQHNRSSRFQDGNISQIAGSENEYSTTLNLKYHLDHSNETVEHSCHQDSECEVNEVCLLQAGNQYICMCASGFDRNKTGACVQQRFFFKHFCNLTESEKLYSVVSIEFAATIDVVEWFREYDNLFRLTIVSLLTTNTSEKYSIDSKGVIYVAPTPMKINESFSVSFVIHNPNKTNNYYQPAAEITQELREKQSQLEETLKLQILSIDTGYGNGTNSHNLCEKAEMEEENVLYLVFLGIGIAGLLAICGVLLYTIECSFKSRVQIKRKDSKPDQSRRVLYTARGHHLATDIQCTGGGLKEVSNHLDVSEEAVKHLDTSSPHTTIGPEDLIYHRDDSSCPEVLSETAHEQSSKEDIEIDLVEETRM